MVEVDWRVTPSCFPRCREAWGGGEERRTMTIGDYGLGLC